MKRQGPCEAWVIKWEEDMEVGMIKYYCDRCGAEILFDDVVRVEMSRYSVGSNR